MIFVRALFFSFLFVLFACEDKPDQSFPVAKDYQRPEIPTLSHEEAKLRSLTVKNVEYYVQIDVTKSQRYSGFVEIKFDYTPAPYPLTIDFVAGEAEQINVNNNPVPINYSGNFISIPSELLDIGTNIIKVQFSHAYSDNGTGLNRFSDPLDDKSYLYSNFEPYYANRLFPQFDQPDMLSTYILKVVTPKEWTVVSSVMEIEIIEDGPYKRWHFPKSPKVSSHSFTLNAGPWHVWEGKSGKIPLRLMTRQSVAAKTDVREWFRITQLGFQFLQKYLAMPFPYTKYDQIIVPDANNDGAANTGGAIFSEHLVTGENLTNDQRNAIAKVIVRELSQMWFSNLLTVDWWNDIWIRESLVNYLAPLALADVTEDEGVWNDFFIHAKPEAYKADQSIASTAINRPVADSNGTLVDIDLMTSAKGAAVIQQLSYYLGENTFRNGLRAYLKKYIYQSSNQNDFFDIMEDTSGKQLNDWIRTWINTPGVNTLSANFQCKNNTITEFSLIQTATEKYPVMREQLLQVAFYGMVDNQIKATTILAVSIKDENTQINSFIGQPCPLLVYPNYGNWGYIKVKLDQYTQQNLAKNITNVDDSLARSLFWQALWQQVIDLEMPLNQYLNKLLEHLGTETDTQVITVLLSHLTQANQWINKATPTQQNAKFLMSLFEDLLLQKFQLLDDNPDQQKIWFDSFIKIAQSEYNLDYLSKWLQGKRQPIALNSNQEMRWHALVRLSTFNHHDIEPLLKLEQYHDETEYGLMMRDNVQASRPDPEIKVNFLDQLVREEDRQTAAKLKQSLKYLFPVEQSNIHQLFAARIFKDLRYLDSHRYQEILKTLVSTILPIFCDNDSAMMLLEESENMSDLGLIAQKAVLEALHENENCLAINLGMMQSLAEEQHIYLSRHAEKLSDSPNPGLTGKGKQRAQWLADYLNDKSIEVIYSTDYERTRQTAAPVALVFGKEITIYQPDKQSEFAKQLLMDGRNSFITGHSNTTPALVKLLGGNPGQPIADHQYDRMYLLVIDKKGHVTTIELKSKAIAPIAQ